VTCSLPLVSQDTYELELIEARDEIEAREVFNMYSADGVSIEPKALREQLRKLCLVCRRCAASDLSCPVMSCHLLTCDVVTHASV
jgi:hypothetical protein